jgi:hypothetical protein
MPRITGLRSPAIALALFLAAAPGVLAVGYVAPDELQAGDRCVGKTVFAGSEIDSFDLTVLGVVHGASPGGVIIIARAEDELLDRTGILQGMSGSPVYLDGRLVGAVAGTWPFAEEPIAAITPIGEMLPALDALDHATPEGGGGGRAIRGSDLIPPGEGRASRIRWVARACGLGRTDEPGEAPLGLGAFAGREVARLDLPLAISSSDTRFLSRLSTILSPSGLVPVAGPGRAGGVAAGPLEPGASVGVQLVGGDMTVAAIGTVTHIEGDRVLAFGHPLFNSGSIEMPMVGAYVHALMPLQVASFKYATGTDVIGAVLVDRRRAIAGRVGAPAPTIPLRVSVSTAGASEAKRYSFDVVRARALSSFFAGAAVADAVSEAAKSVGATSVTFRAVVSTSGENIEYENVFFTEDPIFRTAGELGTLLEVIQDNTFEEIELTEVTLDVTIREGVELVEIARAEAARSVYRPGDTVRVSLTLRDWRGPEFTEAVDLVLPKLLADGEVHLKVGGASSFHEWEADRLGDGLRPRTYAQLLDLIEWSRPGNTVVAQIIAPGRGLSLSGSEMREIPGRAALVLATSATSGAVDPTDGVVVAEAELALTSEVQGDHEIVLHIRGDR